MNTYEIHGPEAFAKKFRGRYTLRQIANLATREKVKGTIQILNTLTYQPHSFWKAWDRWMLE
jgi:hypothetical protein